MRYAVISDVHANLPAWRSVLTDIAAQHTDRIICLGDCIGYGPNPAEVLESLYQHVSWFCLGNHDAAVCGKLDHNLFQPHARRLLDWTKSRLTTKAVDFLSTLPLELSDPGFRCCHGDFTEPAAFNYIESSSDASHCWPVTLAPLLFVGHTHVPTMFVTGASGATHQLPPEDFIIEPGKRYLVNPGSVGSPRSGDALASYCIYDTTTGAVSWRAVPFDLDACREAAIQAGFSEDDTPFLARDPRQRLAAVREAVTFSPAQTPAELARDAVALSEITQLSRSARRWKRVTLFTAIAGLLLLAAVTLFAFSKNRYATAPDSLTTPLYELSPVNSATPHNLLPSFPASTDGASLDGWRVYLERPPDMSLAPDNIGIALQVNGRAAHFRIESAPIRIDRNTIRKVRLTTTWEWHKATDYKVVFVIEELGSPEKSSYPVLRRDTKDPPTTKNSLTHTSRAERLHSQTRYIRLAIEGECAGTILFAPPTLTPIK